jgi:ATP-binding cassette subfamily C protein
MPRQTDQLSWAYVRGLALRHRRALLLANLVAVLATLCSVPIPLLLPLLVDEVLLGEGDRALKVMDLWLPAAWQGTVGYLLLMLTLTLVLRLGALAFNVLQVRLFAQLSKDIVYRIRVRLIERLKRIALEEYETLGSGALTTHLVTDLDTLDRFIGETLSRFLVSVLTLVGTSAVLLCMHWQLALLILFFNPLVIYATTLLGKRVKHLKKLENDSTSGFSQLLSEILGAIQEVRASNRQDYFLGRLGVYAREVRDYAVASQWKSDASSRASGLLFQFGIDVFRAAAMFTVLFSDLSIGQMLAVFSYLWFMISPVEQLLGLQYAFYAADGSLVRLNELLARHDEPCYPGGADPFQGRDTVAIEIRDLSFSYAEDAVLRHLNLSIAAGEKVAIVGASGGGKSTLVQLLLGLYSPQSGSILFGGYTQSEIGLSTLRQQVAVVLQHPALFNDSVRANLCLGRARSDEDCWRALQIAQLAQSIGQLPQGLDSVVGRGGVRLSGGQRQRLAIARMILANPKVVILDEATSALDAATEYALHQALGQFLKGRTTLIIAHRLSAVKQADRVLVLDAGSVAEDGEHERLIVEGGLYAKLYGNLQQ